MRRSTIRVVPAFVNVSNNMFGQILGNPEGTGFGLILLVFFAMILVPILVAWGAAMAIIGLEGDIGFAALLFTLFIAMLWITTGRLAHCPSSIGPDRTPMPGYCISIFRLLSLATCTHFSMSAFMKSVSSVGELMGTSNPDSSNHFLTAGTSAKST